MGSIESPFQFVSYKVDKLNLELDDNVGALLRGTQDTECKWSFKLGFRQPQYLVEDKLYIAGLDLMMRLAYPEEEGLPQKDILQLKAGVAGVFACDNAELSQETEERLVRLQLPALLLPYLRSTITALLASGGYGSVILPLINVHALAKEQTDNLEILRVQSNRPEEIEA